jgi:outer membrane lipoprotein-sorting protein
MKPAERIKQFFKNAELGIDADTDEKVFNDVLQAQQKVTENLPAVPGIWRITMKNPLTKLAVAAVVIIACLIGMFFWKGTSSGIALADVLARIEQVSTYMYHVSLTITGLTESPTPGESSGTVLISQDHGQKATITMIDPNTSESTCQEMYLLPRQKTMVIVMPEKKAYIRMKLDDTNIERFEKQYSDPRAMIKKILSCQYTSLGQSVIDGSTVEGFQTTDPAYEGSVVGQVDVKLWVDVKTWLPVRAEMLAIDDTVRTYRVIDNFQWNVSMNAAEFEPNIPDDYSAPFGDLTAPALNEEAAIEGLSVYAGLAGDYPDNLGGIAFMKQLEELMNRQASGPVKDLPPAEKARILKDIGIPIAGLCSFYETLVQDKKDPAYYGKIVTPQDADKVLMRWKVSDNEYRVIFGDLRAETVTKEKLAELEKALPK